MKTRPIVATLLLFLALSCSSTPRPTVEITNAEAEDHVIRVEGHDELEELFRQLQPAVDEAKRTYAEARRRFLAGLPEGSHFFVTTRLSDARGALEQLFVLVDGFKGSAADGRIWSEVQNLEGYERGQVILAREADVVDWTIVDAQGLEEGNFVGKLYDKLQGISH